MKNQITPKQDDVFFYLMLLTSFFILLEISFFIQCNRTYLSDFTFMSDHLKLPSTILPGVLFFIFSQLLVHFCYGLIIWIMTYSISNLFAFTTNQKIVLGISLWIIGILAVLAGNQWIFPNSKFAELSALILNEKGAKWLTLSAGSFLMLIMIVAMLANRFLKLIFIVSVLAFNFNIMSQDKKNPIDAATKEKPNIIIIGVDSLRPDFLSFFGYDKSTPFFDSFLEHATVFNEAVTPLARTFPSWTSILIGQYPIESGIRTNLNQQDRIQFSQTLPSILKKEGYQTLYATDETRFSNIDQHYGFDQVVSPPMGLNDFLLGAFNDFPLSNLLINTPIGKWLFPYSYGNRPVYFTYEPDSFLKLVKPYLSENRTKPLFLAIHFCLPHHPYLWRSLSGRSNEPLERYEKSIQRADQQLHDFFLLLEKNNLLKHTLVVLLSDHGEALELFGDRITEAELFLSKTGKTPVPRFYPPSLDKESVNQSVGHGTDVLSLTQYHTLLAFKLYGMGPQQEKIRPGVVSLLDIKPSILELSHAQQSFGNKNSLAPFIIGKAGAINQKRHIFLESDFTPGAIRTVYPETRMVVLEGIKIFQIDPKTTRLTVKPDMNNMIIKSKQYADIYDHWMLAFYPQNDHYRMPILIDLMTGKWTNDLHTPFAYRSPAHKMLAAMRTFYRDEMN